jgi:hypothetical protein
MGSSHLGRGELPVPTPMVHRGHEAKGVEVNGSSAARTAGPALVISPDAACAALARRHVAEALQAIDRAELSDVARLAVTELATNAALHARTPMTVTVRLLPDGEVRIEVGDRSTVMPRKHPDCLTSTGGRGLHLVEALGRWGVDPVVEGGRRVGKVVWFSPTDQPDRRTRPDPQPDQPDRRPDIMPGSSEADPTAPHRDDPGRRLGCHLTREEDGSVGTETPPGLVTVRLLGFPLQIFAEAREHHDELIRELCLLSLQPAEDRRTHGLLPPRLRELVTLLGRRHGPLGEPGHADRNAAAARGDLAADLTYHVTPGKAEEFSHLVALLEEADAHCRAGRLLTMPSPALLTRFRRWQATEFTRQASGQSPVPWDGPLSLEEQVRPA